VVPGSCAEIRAGVRTGSLDLGLVLEPRRAKSDGLYTTRLLVLARSKDSLASRPATAAKLASRTFSLSDVAGSFHEVMRRYFREAGVPMPKMEAAGSVEAVKRMVAAGDHLGVLPAFAVASELESRTIVSLKVEPPLPPIVLSAVHPAARRPVPATRDLLELLRAPEEGSA
jgi:DNA-binding transcriptional LysR family regulator